MLAELLELAPSGVEEKELSDGTVEYSVYGAPGELPLLPDLEAAAGDALVEVRTEEIADNWAERWREFHRPLVIEDKLTVRPPWEPPGATPIDIVIDPGRAFGTGAHPTTRLCLEVLLSLAPGAGRLVDLGTGSGVLAIAAARLGWEPVLALDYDRAAVDAATRNASRNGMRLQVQRYDVLTDPVEGSVAPIVAANLLAPLLVAWAERLGESTVLPGRVIASGVLRAEAHQVTEAFAVLGLHETARLTGGDWAALVLESETFSD